MLMLALQARPHSHCNGLKACTHTHPHASHSTATATVLEPSPASTALLSMYLLGQHQQNGPSLIYTSKTSLPHEAPTSTTTRVQTAMPASCPVAGCSDLLWDRPAHLWHTHYVAMLSYLMPLLLTQWAVLPRYMQPRTAALSSDWHVAVVASDSGLVLHTRQDSTLIILSACCCACERHGARATCEALNTQVIRSACCCACEQHGARACPAGDQARP